MNSEPESVSAEDLLAAMLGGLQVVTVDDEDLARAARLLEGRTIWAPPARWRGRRQRIFHRAPP